MRSSSMFYSNGWQKRRRFAGGLAIAMAVLGTMPSVRAQVSIVDLGTLGGIGSTATAINDSGQVVGSAFTTSTSYSDPFLWTPGGTSGVATNPQMQNVFPGSNAQAVGISAGGAVVGNTNPGSEFSQGFIWTATGSAQRLGTLGGLSSVAVGVNSAQMVVGGSDPNTGAFDSSYAFLWSANGTAGPISNPQMQNLGLFSAAAINDTNHVAGNDSSGIAAIYFNFAIQELGTLGGSASTATAINSGGLAAGTSLTGSGNLHAFLWTSGGTSGVTGNPQMQDLGDLGGGTSDTMGIDNNGDVVGYSSTTTGATHAFVYTHSGGILDLNSILPTNSGWTLNRANAINNKGQIVGQGINKAGQSDAFLLTDPLLTAITSANLTWFNNPSLNGDGITWDIAKNTNWNGGAAAYSDGSNVTFDGSTTNTHAIVLNTIVKPASVTVNTTTDNYIITGTGSIAGSGSLTLASTNTSTFLLETSDSYTGGTNVSGGTLALAAAGAFPAGTNLTIESGASVRANVITGSKFDLFASALSLAGTTNQWTARLDLGNNDLVIASENLQVIGNQIQQGFNRGTWQASGGIESSAAALDSTHTTALGVIQNSVDGTASGTALYSMFDGQAVTDADVLVKYTYYGDTNLDGKVDGSDYSQIDSGYLLHATGWRNGDFNYDGVVNGSDYTLIDNAFNHQGGIISDLLASPNAALAAQVTNQRSFTAVPEPDCCLGMMTLAVLLRSFRKR